MTDTKMLTAWTTTTWGKWVVGVSILTLGLGHFGRKPRFTDWKIPVVGWTPGTVGGGVGVLIGATILIDSFTGA